MSRSVGQGPPVLVLGGAQNALSIARCLGRRGIDVAVSVCEREHVLHSRFCSRRFPFAAHEEAAGFWKELLLSSAGHGLRGRVILVGSDTAVEFVARHRDELVRSYILDDSVPELSLALLDKRRTLEMARSLGVHTPRTWELAEPADLSRIADQLVFPLLVKPVHSHLFQWRFDNRKHFRVHDLGELRSALDRTRAKDVEVTLTEFIPGPDSLLWYYSTYIDADGSPLFHFTKRITRRYPCHEGLSCHQVALWNQEVAECGLRFFRGIGLRGLGHIEFKRDPRDGHLKVIECNPRSIAPEELFVRAGVEVPSIVYDHLVGLQVPRPLSYRQRLGFWYPVRDFRAFLELRRRGELTLSNWVRSLAGRQVLPYFRWSDPMPTIRTFLDNCLRYLRKKLARRP